jgi:integrase
MASVRLRDESKMWYACITVDTPAGRKQKHFSTGLTDKNEALGVAVAAERAARKYGVAPHQLRKALENLAEEYTPVADADPAEWLERWGKGVAGTVAKGTGVAYAAIAEAAAIWCRANRVKSFAALTTAKLKAMRDDWLAVGNSPVTCNTKIKRLSVALEAAHKEKLLSENPAVTLDPLRVETTKRREFRADELKSLLDVLTGEWRALVMLGFYTGQRLNDLAELSWHQLDLVAGTIRFHTRKTDALVSLPLTRTAIDALAELPAGETLNAPVFTEIAKLARETRSNHFRTLLASVGLARPIDRKERLGGRSKRKVAELTFHSLRHTATSNLKSAGVSDAVARAIIGHESAAVSRAYTHLDTETLRTALEKLPSL